MIKKKYFLIIAIISLLAILVSLFDKSDFVGIKIFLKRHLNPQLFSVLQLFGDIERSTKKLNNDYNEKFLPETQFINLEFIKTELEFKDYDIAGYAQHLKVKVKQVFYIEKYLDKLMILTSNGNLYYNNYEDILSKGNLKKIETDLNLETALDLLVDKDNIYISGFSVKENCAFLELHKAKISEINNLKFNQIFKSSECVSKILSGRLAKFKDKNSLLLSTAADVFKNDQMDDKPQNDNSIYGKILEIDLETNNFKIFSKGHRNILGLYVDKEVILSTENGPYGGDEINHIHYGKNYGWPIVSYGQKYSNNEYYPNSHYEYGFEEPIYSFVPSVGISQIEKIGEKFSKKWSDNFLVASLNGNHIFRMKFDRNYQKVFFIEKIFIGERMRDLVFHDEKNVFLIALESSGSLGVLKKQ